MGWMGQLAQTRPNETRLYSPEFRTGPTPPFTTLTERWARAEKFPRPPMMTVVARAPSLSIHTPGGRAAGPTGTPDARARPSRNGQLTIPLPNGRVRPRERAREDSESATAGRGRAGEIRTVRSATDGG